MVISHCEIQTDKFYIYNRSEVKIINRSKSQKHSSYYQKCYYMLLYFVGNIENTRCISDKVNIILTSDTKVLINYILAHSGEQDTKCGRAHKKLLY